MSHLSVSIVIPTFNRAALLERALRSAHTQCEAGDEVLVVDDGSTDETEAAAHTFGPQVKYLRTQHKGAGAARNAGLRAAAGDLVAFLDSDDEWYPGKLSAQRAILEQFSEILFLFSDFSGVAVSGEINHHQVATWRNSTRSWDEILAERIASTTIPGLHDTLPSFTLRVGRLYEDLIRHWSVFAGTVVVRRVSAGDALHFAEDVKTYEDIECFGRLAGRGLAGYMDCDTAYQHAHIGARLTDTDAITAADAAITVISRVWGTDADYLRDHRHDFEAAVDEHRVRKARALLGRGTPDEARQELSRCFRPPRLLRALTLAPASLSRSAIEARRAWRSLR
jgi:glycosyltransferase involved in cell wall biosynthesis